MTSPVRTFYLSGCDINYKETDSDGNVAVTGFVATLQAGDHDFTPPTKVFELGLDLITKANTHGEMLAALKVFKQWADKWADSAGNAAAFNKTDQYRLMEAAIAKAGRGQ